MLMDVDVEVKLAKGEIVWRHGRGWNSRKVDSYFLEMLSSPGELSFTVPEKFAGDWYVVQTQPQQERAVAGGLIGRRFAAYLPMRKRKVRGCHPHHHREVEAPMLPGYLFTTFARGGETWPRIKTTAGVIDVLGGDCLPLSVPLSDLLRIRDKELELATGARILRIDDTPIQIGDNVLLEDGAFASFSGKVVEILFNREQVKVEIDLFGRKTPVTTEVAMLRAL